MLDKRIANAIQCSTGTSEGGEIKMVRFTVKQAAEYFGVDPQTIYRWVDAGKLSCTRTPGGGIRFTQDDYDKSSKKEKGDSHDHNEKEV